MTAATPPSGPRPSHTIRILLAEDNPTNQLVAQGMLSLAGYSNVTLALDGEQAVAAVERGGFDIVLMDCRMPRLDGYDATARLRAAGHDVPIIALTANATPVERDRCLAVGMNDFLSKPIDEVSLAEAIARWTYGCVTDATPARGASSMEPERAFSRAAALDQLGGDEEFLAAVLGSFGEHAPALLRSARESLAAGDAIGLRRHLHSLAGSAGTLSAGALRLLALELEALAGNEHLAEVTARMPEIEDVMARFFREARDW